MVITMYYYLNYFFLFSIFGHFIEGFFYSDGDSGILNGYWTPIYGLGVIVIIIFYNAIKPFIENAKFKKFLSVFMIGAVSLSFLEYVGGIIIETLFHIVFCNYSSMRFNIGKYTSLEMAFIWGIASVILIYLIKPLVDKFIKKIPKLITWILLILLSVDLISMIFKIK